MKKIVYRSVFLALILALMLSFSSVAYAEGVTGSEAESEEDGALKPESAISGSITAYSSLSIYSGAELKTNLEPEDILEVRAGDHGGVRTDPTGREVFSNYVTLSLKMKTKDSTMKVGGGNARIISEQGYSYDGKHIGSHGRKTLSAVIGYGAILVSKESGSGTSEAFEPMYVRRYDDSLSELRLTEDGDYHIVILVTAIENGIAKKIAVEYTLSVRTKLYITDSSGEYQVRDAGAYHSAVRLDALSRTGVDIRVNGAAVADGYILDGIGRHEIKVYANGFLADKINFEIFSRDDQHVYIYLSNARRTLDSISYECENNFKVSWYSTYASAKMTYWKNGDRERVYNYTAGESITEAGVYVFTLNVPEIENERNTFLVRLVGNDYPENNYNTLSGRRHNNFKTKWYEVYDSGTGLYYCFSTAEYQAAYDAAMTVEKRDITDYGHYFIYNGRKYTDNAELCAAVTKAASENVRTVYYDPEAEKIEKYFSNRSFDGTVYLGRDFEFVRTSPAETNEVTLTDSLGNVTEIAFFTPLSEYSLGEGIYTVTERDLYGNETTYSAVIDRTAPTVSLELDGVSAELYGNITYSARYFTLKGLLDPSDPYATLSVRHTSGDRVTGEYFISDECDGRIFSLPGRYDVRLYDRNNNIMKFTVLIGEGKQTSVTVGDSGVTLTLIGDSVRVTEVYENGIYSPDLAVGRSYTFDRDNGRNTYTVYTVDSVTGVTDVIEFTVDAREETPEDESGDKTPPVSGVTLSSGARYLIIIGAVTVFGGGAAVAIIFIWRKSDEE